MTLLKELVSVAKSLGAVSTHDLQSLEQQLEVAKRDAMARVSSRHRDGWKSSSAML